MLSILLYLVFTLWLFCSPVPSPLLHPSSDKGDKWGALGSHLTIIVMPDNWERMGVENYSESESIKMEKDDIPGLQFSEILWLWICQVISILQITGMITGLIIASFLSILLPNCFDRAKKKKKANKQKPWQVNLLSSSFWLQGKSKYRDQFWRWMKLGGFKVER